MKTYELIRRLVALDNTGERDVYLSIKVLDENGKEREATGLVEDLWGEILDTDNNAGLAVVIKATDL